MVLKEEKDRIRTLISETLTLMCKNGLNYKAEFSIDALVGITLDQKEEFFLSIKDGFSFRPVMEEDNGIPHTTKKNNHAHRQESVDEAASPIKDVEGEASEHEAQSSRRKRKRRRSSGAYSDTTGEEAANGGEEGHKGNNKPEIITNFSLQDLQQLHDNAADELWTSITGEGDENAPSSPSQRETNSSHPDPAAAVKKPHVDDETSYSSMSETGGRTPVTPASVKQESYAQEEDEEEGEVLYIKDEPESDDNDTSNDQAYGAKHYPMNSSPRGHASSSYMPPHHLTPPAHHSPFNASNWNPALSMQQNTAGNISRQGFRGHSDHFGVFPLSPLPLSREAPSGPRPPPGDGDEPSLPYGDQESRRSSGLWRVRSENWTEEETVAMLVIWRRMDVARARRQPGLYNRLPFYEAIAAELRADHDIFIEPRRIRVRISNLKQAYKTKTDEEKQLWMYSKFLE